MAGTSESRTGVHVGPGSSSLTHSDKPGVPASGTFSGARLRLASRRRLGAYQTRKTSGPVWERLRGCDGPGDTRGGWRRCCPPRPRAWALVFCPRLAHFVPQQVVRLTDACPSRMCQARWSEGSSCWIILVLGPGNNYQAPPAQGSVPGMPHTCARDFAESLGNFAPPILRQGAGAGPKAQTHTHVGIRILTQPITTAHTKRSTAASNPFVHAPLHPGNTYRTVITQCCLLPTNTTVSADGTYSASLPIEAIPLPGVRYQQG